MKGLVGGDEQEYLRYGGVDVGQVSRLCNNMALGVIVAVILSERRCDRG
jgi:hypothetical protein